MSTTQTYLLGEKGFPFHIPKKKKKNKKKKKKSIATVVEIEEDDRGAISLKELERNLIKYQDRPLKIGSFSAASNVSGVLTDTKPIASLLHKYGALSFWDYAAAAPHAKIEMNPGLLNGYSCHKDAVFISPHKFVDLYLCSLNHFGSDSIFESKDKTTSNTFDNSWRSSFFSYFDIIIVYDFIW